MSDNTLDTLLAQRGYQRIASPDRMWRSWLWVAPIRDDGIPTKLCNGQWNLTSEGLHWLLESQYYSDEQRTHNKRCSIVADEREK
jgi:hypothetical protein